MTKKVCLLLADGFEELEAVGTYALLCRGGLDVNLYALSNQDTTGRFGLNCTNLRPFSSLEARCMIFLPAMTFAST